MVSYSLNFYVEYCLTQRAMPYSLDKEFWVFPLSYSLTIDFLNSSSNLRGDFLLFPIAKSPFKICVYLFKSIPKNVSTLLGYMHKKMPNKMEIKYKVSYKKLWKLLIRQGDAKEGLTDQV